MQMFGSKIPLAAKVAVTAFLAVLVPVYLHTYGPTNFLWFCDAALILMVAGMWLESSILVSMCAVGIPATAMPLAHGLWRQPTGVSFSEPDQLYVRPRAATVHSCAFTVSRLAAHAARLAPVPPGL